MPNLSSSPWIRGVPQSGLSLLICRIRSRISRSTDGRPSSSANAKTSAIPDGATGSPLPALPTPSPPDSAATIGRARPRASGRSRTAGADPAAGGEERASGDGARGSLAPQPPDYESAGKHRDDGSFELKHAGDTMAAHPKTLGFSAHSEFLVGIGQTHTGEEHVGHKTRPSDRGGVAVKRGFDPIIG